MLKQKEKSEISKKRTASKKHDFLLSAKNLYLTYSKCNLLLDKVLSQLKSILSSYILKEYLLVREYHADGEPHVHVYLKMLKKNKYLFRNFFRFRRFIWENLSWQLSKC